MNIEKYGKRLKFNNPFKKKSGWVYLNMSRVLAKQIIRLEQ